MPLRLTSNCSGCHTPTVIYLVSEWVFYAFIFVPLLARVLLMLIFRNKMSDSLLEDEGARDTYRSYLYAYLAISTAILLALTVANAKGEINLNEAVFCAAISFVEFELALSLQTYKFKVFHDQLADGLIDGGRLGLYLTIIAVFNSVKGGLTPLTSTLIAILLLTFMADFAVKTYYNIKTL